MSVCSVYKCERPVRARGLCSSHHWRLLEGLPLDTPIKPHYKALSNTCTLKGCHRRYYAKGFCQSHYRQWYKNKPLTPPKPPKAKVFVLPEWAVPISKPEPCECGITAICHVKTHIGRPDDTYSNTRTKATWLVLCWGCLQFERYVRQEIPYSDLSALLQEVA